MTPIVLGALLAGIPWGIVGWIGGRADWNGRLRYWREAAQRRPVIQIVTAIPAGHQHAHVVIDTGPWRALETREGT